MTKLAERSDQLKPFRKENRNTVTVTIEGDGSMTFLKTDAADIFLEMGAVVTRRASHVEPYDFWPRLAFTVIRALVSDKSQVAEWTRGWKVLWRVNTKPVGGPILRWKHRGYPFAAYENKIAAWSKRQDAIDAEIVFLNKFFAERGTK